MTPPYRRILLTRMKFIGDIVLTTPIIRSVRLAYPDAYIAYMGERKAVSLLEHNPHLNEIIPFDFSRPTILEQTRVAFQLRRRQFDLAIDMFGNPRTALLTYVSGARTRVGQEKKGRGRLYTIQVRDEPRRKNAIEFHAQFLKAAGIPFAGGSTELFLTTEERRAGARRLPPGPVVGIHPGATWPAKKWPAQRFGLLAERLVRDAGVSVVVTSGPDDADTLREMVRGVSVPLTVLPVMPLRELAAVIAGCAAYVSNDAGPMHIAAALDVPTVGIFGPGEEDIWFPYPAERGHRALRKDVPCHPCHLDFCNLEGPDFMRCMALLTVEEVLEAVRRALSRGR